MFLRKMNQVLQPQSPRIFVRFGATSLSLAPAGFGHFWLAATAPNSIDSVGLVPR